MNDTPIGCTSLKRQRRLILRFRVWLGEAEDEGCLLSVAAEGGALIIL